MEAEYANASKRQIVNRCSRTAASLSLGSFVECTRLTKAIATGTIIAAQAVLLIKADSVPVVSMMPKTIFFGVAPMQLITNKAIRRSRPHFVTPAAKMKAPINRKIVSDAYGAMAAAGLQTPKSGKSTIGRSDVTEIGAVSKHHQIAIQTRTPRQARPA